MIEALLILAADPAAMTAIDAERAFAADAQKIGQWTAFRKWSSPNATMFTPQAGKAHDFLKPLKDPPVAVFWWPGRSYVSCDGNTAVNTGPWVREWGKSVGYFTTVWQRQADGSWKWLLDHGDALQTARGEGGDIKARKASCTGKLPKSSGDPPRHGGDGHGYSHDGTLAWQWAVQPDGSRIFRAYLFDGSDFDLVIDDKVAATP